MIVISKIEHRLTADLVAQDGPGRNRAESDQVGDDDHPQQTAPGHSDCGRSVGQGVDAEQGADH
jgi:hypothetical protein